MALCIQILLKTLLCPTVFIMLIFFDQVTISLIQILLETPPPIPLYSDTTEITLKMKENISLTGRNWRLRIPEDASKCIPRPEAQRWKKVIELLI